MIRRTFLALIGGLPFIRWSKPKPPWERIKHTLTIIQLPNGNFTSEFQWFIDGRKVAHSDLPEGITKTPCQRSMRIDEKGYFYTLKEWWHPDLVSRLKQCRRYRYVGLDFDGEMKPLEQLT